MHPAITPARHVGTRFTYTAEGWKAELILVDGWLVYLSADSHPSK